MPSRSRAISRLSAPRKRAEADSRREGPTAAALDSAFSRSIWHRGHHARKCAGMAAIIMNRSRRCTSSIEIASALSWGGPRLAAMARAATPWKRIQAELRRPPRDTDWPCRVLVGGVLGCALLVFRRPGSLTGSGRPLIASLANRLASRSLSNRTASTELTKPWHPPEPCIGHLMPAACTWAVASPSAPRTYDTAQLVHIACPSHCGVANVGLLSKHTRHALCSE